MPENYESLNEWCKVVRKTMIDRELNVTELTAKVGKSRPHVSGVVNGRIINDDTQKRISNILGIPPWSGHSIV